MLLIILVRGFCPLKIKILSPNFLVDSVLIHLIVAPRPPPPYPHTPSLLSLKRFIVMF